MNWVPDWGKSRIEAAVKGRPDWCISRQRTWGVPIPAFYDAQGNPILDAQIVRNAAALVEQHGSNVWFEKSAAELWAALKPADWKGPEAAAKSNDTLDVWIDSGSSSRSCSCAARNCIDALTADDPPRNLRHAAAHPALGRATCTWKAATSIAAGSSPRCCSRWPATAPRPSRPC